MTTALSTKVEGGELLERVVIGDDLSKLEPADRVRYYAAVCQSLNLNPLTKPFAYITLQGRLTLYAKRDCTDQLRARNGVSVKITSREVIDDCLVVTAVATTADGRSDEAIGVVSMEGLKGGEKANAMMKAETKAKRRVTLSICGLGLPDESEIEETKQVLVDQDTGEIRTPMKAISPMSGALEDQDAATMTEIERLATSVGGFAAKGAVKDAFDLIESAALDNEQKTALWALLTSEHRAALKKEGASRRQATGPTISEVSALIQAGKLDDAEALAGQFPEASRVTLMAQIKAKRRETQ